MPNFNGGPEDDTFMGGADDDTAFGHGGNDRLVGRGGHDMLDGGADNDTLAGEAGDDTLIGGGGNDLLDGDEGSDTIFGNEGDDIGRVRGGTNNADTPLDLVDLGEGNDFLEVRYLNVTQSVVMTDPSLDGPGTFAIGGEVRLSFVGVERFDVAAGSADDLLYGGAADDRLVGGGGLDTLIGGGGNDRLEGGNGNDVLIGGDGSDELFGNEGNDTAFIVGGTTHADTRFEFVDLGGGSLDRLDVDYSNITQSVVMTDPLLNGPGTIKIHDSPRLSFAGVEQFYLTTGSGADILYGGAGADRLAGGGGGDLYYVNNASDQLLEAAGEGDDHVSTGVSYTLAAGVSVESMSILGPGIGPTTTIALTGNEFSQTMHGHNGTNILNGGGGADIMRGESGDDSYYVDDAGDQVIEAADNGSDRVFASASYTLADRVSVEMFTTINAAGTTAIDLTGNDIVNAIHGNAGANTLNGKGGADTLVAMGGNDTLDGGTGADRLEGGTGDDLYHIDEQGDLVIETAGGGNDRVVTSIAFQLYALPAAAQVETLEASAGAYAIDLAGNDFAQTLIGNNGANSLDGKGGADVLRGLGGDDIYFVDVAGDIVTEAAGAGSDRVTSTVSYALAAGSEVERLETASAAGTGALNLTGNGFAQTLRGNAGANILDGRGGADTLAGFGGNDFYYVDDMGDVVEEAAGQGSDRVSASVSYTLAAGVSVETLTTSNNVGTAAIDLTGNELANIIYGNDGANVLDGRAGADSLVGRLGDDWFYVDNAADLVVEAVGEGSDRVLASVSYTLAAAAHVELLATSLDTGTGAINLTANGLANTVRGNDAANILDGKGGADVLIGRLGNDFYYVDTAADQVVETAGQGADRVFASASYTLGAGVSVETMTTTNNVGTAAINLTGNELANIIYGNDGANILSGGGGADTLVGWLGDDSFYVDDAADRVVETAGQGADRVFTGVSYTLGAGVSVETFTTSANTAITAINLTGNEFTNTIYGNDGANVIDGKGGADTLVGRAGADSFAFTTALGATNVDRIADFNGADDTIRLDDALFTRVGGPGALNAGAFRTGAAAQDADDRIVYNAGTGQLFYDADGNGAGAAVLFATLTGTPALAASDFLVI